MYTAKGNVPKMELSHLFIQFIKTEGRTIKNKHVIGTHFPTTVVMAVTDYVTITF